MEIRTTMKFNVKLSKREMEIAELLAWGGARKEVADRLCVTLSTIETTAGNIYKKIGINKASELTVWWFVKMLNVPISLDPWKRKVIAILFLAMILPREIMGVGDVFRTRSQRVQVTARARRSRDNDINLF